MEDFRMKTQSSESTIIESFKLYNKKTKNKTKQLWKVQ